MKRFAIRHIIPYLACLASLVTGAQEYSFQLFTPAAGLPTAEITAIGKDSQGFLWAGTPIGISRYDGYTFTHFSYSQDKQPVGHVNVIRLAADGVLWIGTASGLFRLENNTLRRVTGAAATDQSVYDIQFGPDKELLLATKKGPAIITASQTQMQELDLEDFVLPSWKKRSGETDSKKVIRFSRAPDGTLYTAQQKAIFRLTAEKAELVYLDEKGTENILHLFPVNQHTVLFDASRTELNRIENGKRTSYNFESLTQAKPVSNPSALLWYIGTRGIFGLDTVSMRAPVFINTMDQGIFWPTDLLMDGPVFWVSSHEGLLRIKPSIFRSYHDPSSGGRPEVYSFFKPNEQTLLAGSNRGKIVQIQKEVLSPSAILPTPLVSYAEIRCMWLDKNGGLWAGTGYQGLVRYKNGRKETFTTSEGLHNNSIQFLLPASNNRLFAIGDHGITEITGSEEKGYSFKAFSFPSAISLYSHCYAGVETPKGNILFGGEEGLWLQKDNKITPYPFLGKRLPLTDIIRDENDHLYLATTGEGILECRFGKNDSLVLVRKFSTEQGLPGRNFLCLLLDKNGFLWAGHSNGLSRIDIRQPKGPSPVLNFNQSDGFVPPGYYSMTLVEKGDSIWAGTSSGLVSFSPAKIPDKFPPPKVYITKIINNKQGPESTFYEPDDTRNIFFSFDDNSLEFQFTALDADDQENIRYYYRLEGLDSAWTDAGTRRTASYQELKPGSYIFHVKAINSKGSWSLNEPMFRFVIRPPFWQRGWFLATVVVLLAGFFILFIKIRERNIREKEARKTEIEKLRSSGLQYQLEIEQVVNFFAHSIQDKETVEELLWDVARNCISRLGLEDCVIYLLDRERNVLVQKAAWGPKTTEENKILDPLEIQVGRGIVGHVARTGKAEIISDTSSDPRYIADDARRLSEIAVPLIGNNQVIGVIDSEHPQRDFYTKRHLQILTTIASLCGDRIEKIKAEKEARRKENEVLQLTSDLAASQLTALRAQMNPHFIFNALNSVQQFILQGNAYEANRYLSRFSKLQREILNNSDQHFISLEKEREMLEIYLELEQLRFDENFSFSIRIDDNIDPDDMKIPPMIVQPFVENAIWHGLMPKEGEKHVDIHFSLVNDQELRCQISDNGIGREASSKLRSTGKEHRSRGLALVYERLDILQKQFKHPFEVSILDRLNDQGEVSGTQVTLHLYAGV